MAREVHPMTFQTLIEICFQSRPFIVDLFASTCLFPHLSIVPFNGDIPSFIFNWHSPCKKERYILLDPPLSHFSFEIGHGSVWRSVGATCSSSHPSRQTPCCAPWWWRLSTTKVFQAELGLWIYPPLVLSFIFYFFRFFFLGFLFFFFLYFYIGLSLLAPRSLFKILDGRFPT